MMKSPIVVIACLVAGCASARQTGPELAALPAADAPPCGPEAKKALGKEECTRRLTAFVGRSMRGIALLSATVKDVPGKGTAYDAIGAVIDANGRVLTAYSRIRDMEGIVMTLRRVGGVPGKAGRLSYYEIAHVPMEVVSYSATLDLALLKPIRPVHFDSPLPVDPTIRAFGGDEPVWVIGGGFDTFLTRVPDAVLPSDENLAASDDRVRLRVTLPARDLGGPVISPWGDVIGIMTTLPDKDGKAGFIPVHLAVQLFDLPAARGR